MIDQDDLTQVLVDALKELEEKHDGPYVYEWCDGDVTVDGIVDPKVLAGLVLRGIEARELSDAKRQLKSLKERGVIPIRKELKGF